MKHRSKDKNKVVKGAPSGFVISLIVHAAAFFLAGLFVVFTVLPKEEPEFKAPPPVERPKMKLKKPKVKIKKSSQPKPSSRIVAKVKTAKMPEIQIPDLVGTGEGLLGGLGMGGDFMDLPEMPKVTAYGSTHSTGTELLGVLYDLKYSRHGTYAPSSDGSTYRQTFRNFINSGLNPRKLSNYYRAPQKLYAKCMVFGVQPSAMAPVAFGMPDDMCQGGDWIAHYKGKLVHKEDITFRFWGGADDTIAVFVDGKMVMGASLTESRFSSMFQNGYAPPTMDIGKINLGLSSWPGSWITLKAGVPREMDLVITDNPAPNNVSNCAFVLAVEEKDVEYPKNKLGKKILPIFKTAKLSYDELDVIYESTREGLFDCENGPVFNDFESADEEPK